MPTYEYVCKACGNAWEASQRISEAPLTECPKCHKPEAQRQISGGNFILKGGGWYSDLYSSPKPGSGSKATTETKTETKTDTKSDSTTTSTTPEKK